MCEECRKKDATISRLEEGLAKTERAYRRERELRLSLSRKLVAKP